MNNQIFSGIREALVRLKGEIDKTIDQEIENNKQMGQSFLLRHAVIKTLEVSPADRRIKREMSRKQRREERLKAIDEQ